MCKSAKPFRVPPTTCRNGHRGFHKQNVYGKYYCTICKKASDQRHNEKRGARGRCYETDPLEWFHCGISFTDARSTFHTDESAMSLELVGDLE